MKISLLKKGILVIVPISLISFHLFWFPGRMSYRENNAGPGSDNVDPGSKNAGLEAIMLVPEVAGPRK